MLDGLSSHSVGVKRVITVTNLVLVSEMQGSCGIRRLGVQEGLGLFPSETNRYCIHSVKSFCNFLLIVILTLFSSQDAQSAINEVTGMDDDTWKNCLMFSW